MSCFLLQSHYGALITEALAALSHCSNELLSDASQKIKLHFSKEEMSDDHDNIEHSESDIAAIEEALEKVNIDITEEDVDVSNMEKHADVAEEAEQAEQPAQKKEDEYIEVSLFERLSQLADKSTSIDGENADVERIADDAKRLLSCMLR